MQKPFKSNFDDSFLHDFGLHGAQKHYTGGEISYVWKFNKKALERFHLPITYRNKNGPESDRHYIFKQKIHDYIYEQYYLSEGCKFYVTTELEQVRNPFLSHINQDETTKLIPYDSTERPVMFTLDVCAIRVKDNQVFDFEIDTGNEHHTQVGMRNSETRDRWLKHRYGILTMRIDPNEIYDIDRKEIDRFLAQPACKNPHYDIHTHTVLD